MIVASHSAPPSFPLVESCFLFFISINLNGSQNPTWKSPHKSWDFVTFGVFVLRQSWRTRPSSSCHAFGRAHRHRTTRASWVEATALLTSGKRPSQLLSNALFVSLHGSRSCTRPLWHPAWSWPPLSLARSTSTHLRKAVNAGVKTKVLPAVPGIVQDLETSLTTWEVGKECCPTTLLAPTNCTKNYLLSRWFINSIYERPS